MLNSLIGWIRKRRALLLIFGVGLIVGGWLEFAFLVSWDVLWDTLERWQTLVGALGAIIAAVWTVLTIKRQITLQRKVASEETARHRDVALRRTMSLRAQMPDALAAIASYLEECTSYIAFVAGGREGMLPQQPKEDIGVLKSAIEHMDKDTAQVMMEMVIHYQVHNARLEFKKEDFHEDPIEVEATSVAQRMYDLAILNYMVGKLFPFARMDIGTVAREAPTEAKIITVAREIFCDFLDIGDPPINDGSKYRPLNANIWSSFESTAKLHTMYPVPEISWENSL